MIRAEPTDKPCDKCGHSFDLYLHNEKLEGQDPQSTWKVVRTLLCPECGFQREDMPPPPRR